MPRALVFVSVLGPMLAPLGFLATPTLAQPGADGITWVTIGSPGNAPWQGDGTPGDRAIGRGGVDYTYKIGKYEVTTAQWVEFLNAAMARPDPIPYVYAPDHWGGVGDSSYHGPGHRYVVRPGEDMFAVGDISWRLAAVYCNWLTNGKSTAASAFTSGAYDISTFGYTPQGVFTDQMAHTPGATYWIPTLDEWLKAGFYDPSKNNGAGGWWTYSNGTDMRMVGAPPDLGGTANFGWDTDTYPGRSPFNIPLGAYAQTVSPWGLYDMAGGTTEWLESVWTNTSGTKYRMTHGSYWETSPGYGAADAIYEEGDFFPNEDYYPLGLRIASSIPEPGLLTVLGLGMLLLHGQQRRTPQEPAPCVTSYLS